MLLFSAEKIEKIINLKPFIVRKIGDKSRMLLIEVFIITRGVSKQLAFTTRIHKSFDKEHSWRACQFFSICMSDKLINF